MSSNNKEIPLTTEHRIIFPYESITNKFCHDFYFDLMSGNRLTKDEVDGAFKMINKQCIFNARISGFGALFACNSRKYEKNKQKIAKQLECLERKIYALNKDLKKKNMKFVVPEDGYPDRMPRWIELQRDVCFENLHSPTKLNKIHQEDEKIKKCYSKDPENFSTTISLKTPSS